MRDLRDEAGGRGGGRHKKLGGKAEGGPAGRRMSSIAKGTRGLVGACEAAGGTLVLAVEGEGCRALSDLQLTLSDLQLTPVRPTTDTCPASMQATTTGPPKTVQTSQRPALA